VPVCRAEATCYPELMGKTKRYQALEMLQGEKDETLRLAFAYIAMWGPIRPSDDERIIEDRLRMLEDCLGRTASR